MQRCRVWATVYRGDANEDIFWIGLGILDRDVEVAILRKNTCVDQFIFRFASPTTTILGHQIGIREGALWIFVQGLHVRMSRGTVKKVVVFLHILTMVAFRASQAEEPLL